MVWPNVPAARPEDGSVQLLFDQRRERPAHRSIAYNRSYMTPTHWPRMLSNGNWSRVYRVLCLAGLAAVLLLLASCLERKISAADRLEAGFAQLRSTARSVVMDPARLDTYLEHSHALESVLQSFERDATDFVEQLRSAFTDYGTEQDRLRNLTAQFRDRQRRAQQRFVELHLAMARTVTPEEWQSLSKQEQAILAALFDSTTEALR